MKKPYLIICSILITSVIFAQQKEVAPIEEFNQTIHHQYILPIYTPNYNSVSPISSPFWSSDFSNSSDWVLDNSGQTSPLGWTIDNIVHSWYFSGGQSPSPINSSSGGAFAELTNGDPFTSTSWPMNVVYTMTTASPIAVYDSIGSGNATLSFEEFGARFNDLQEAQVSTDGINFTTVADNLSYAVLSQSGGSSYPNPALRTVNIGPYIASNPDSVWIRFSWTTNFPSSATDPNVWVAYGWMIDDVQLSETPANSISLIEENFGGWLLSNPTTTGDMGIPYTFNPLSQVTANGYECEGAIINGGSMSQNNTKLNIEVFDASTSTSVWSASSTPTTVNPFDTLVAAVSSNFIPTISGSYNIDFWASSDSSFTDTVTRTTIVTDTVYGRDYDWNSNGTNAGNGKKGLGLQNCDQVLANAFEIYSPDTVTSISFFVHDESVANAWLKVELYEYDPSVSVQISQPILLGESDDYSLVTSDINSWVTLKLVNPIIVYPSTSTSTVAYLAAVHGQPNFNDTSLISASGNEGVVSFIQKNGCLTTGQTFGTWFGLSNTLMIRMNLGNIPQINSVDDNVFSRKLSIHPNPSQGIFNIDLVDVKNGDYLISVSNILGEIVYNQKKEVNSTTSMQIDISEFGKGVYFLNVTNSQSSISRKIIIE